MPPGFRPSQAGLLAAVHLPDPMEPSGGSVLAPAVAREAGGVAAGGAGGRNLGWERGKAAKGV